MPDNHFRPRSTTRPMIYAYTDRGYPGLLKIGYTAGDVEERVKQQYPIKLPKPRPYQIIFQKTAMRPEGDIFRDVDIHKHLKKKGLHQEGEWFRCSVKQLEAAYQAALNRTDNEENRTRNFPMRPEQEQAVAKTAAYFQSVNSKGSKRTPKFLWNAKMRFGKTFAAYQLAKRMGFTKVLVFTFKPAVQSAWREDLLTHMDFEGWQYISRRDEDLKYEQADLSRPFVCFGSFQDYLGLDANTGGIKAKNEWVHLTNWDLVIFDEYHFGAWREKAQGLFQHDNEEEEIEENLEGYIRGNAYDETFLPITTNHYLFLSGTPFRALNSGEFIEEQIYSWTYADEQQAKRDWVTPPANPYLSLPRMVMMVYKIPDSIRQIALKGEFNEFDLNEFFSAEGTGKHARFKHEEEVQKWLNLIRGAYLPQEEADLKLGAERPPMPFSDMNLLSALTHTFWLLPNVASCYAMANLLVQRQNTFYRDYRINVAAGTQAGIGLAALDRVMPSMADPLNSKTITLSCGKLTTGVTVRPWTGVFILRNLSSPETYFQTAFRTQSPWTSVNDDGTTEIIKTDCYLFDFALDRALRQVADYSCKLNTGNGNPEQKVQEFLNFLPILAYDGSAMTQVDATALLDFTTAGTSATLLAKRWQSALLVNVDNDTLQRLLNTPEALRALESIEEFRNLNKDIQTIINKSEDVKKKKKSGKELTPKEKKQLSAEEKEYKSKRKQIQEKLIKFATRIPIFMYLTDYREASLVDVITQLEPGLFRKVTGLMVKDFELLMSIGVFNNDLMNDAIFKFRRYEDSSLSYTGVDKHAGQDVGLFSTVLLREEYDKLAQEQQRAMQPGRRAADDVPQKPVKKTVKSSDDDDEEGEESEPEATTSEPKPTQSWLVNDPTKATSKPGIPDITVTELLADIQGAVKGAKVKHNSYGEGIIDRFTQSGKNRNVWCKFKDIKKGSDKMFAYPDAFHEGKLKLI